MDTLSRKFARMGARVAVREVDGRGRRFRIDVARDGRGEYFDLLLDRDTHPRIEVVDVAPNDRHLVLLADGSKFLCGHDERHWFVAAVPETAAAPVTSVESAKEALKPRYDLAKAKALMAEAGHADGFSVTMMAPNNRYVNDDKIAEAVAGMLAKINIKVDLKTMPKAQYWPKFDERAADIMMIGWHSDTEDSSNFTEFLLMTPDAVTGYGQYNSGNYSNPEVDKLILASQKETDDAKRTAMLRKVEQILHDDAAFVPLHWQDRAWAARKGVDIAPILNVMNFPYLGDLVIKN